MRGQSRAGKGGLTGLTPSLCACAAGVGVWPSFALMAAGLDAWGLINISAGLPWRKAREGMSSSASSWLSHYQMLLEPMCTLRDYQVPNRPPLK